MTISILLISSEKMALAMLCRTAALRAKSIDAVELCVGIIDRPARYRWSALSTLTHRTGTLGTGRTSTMERRSAWVGDSRRRRSLWSRLLRSSRNTSSAETKSTVLHRWQRPPGVGTALRRHR